MINEPKIYQKIKKIKTSFSKNKIMIRDNKIKINNYKEYQDDNQESLFKSKSLNKIKIKKGFSINNNTIKLPILKRKIYINNNNQETSESKKNKKYLKKNNTVKKLKINTNSNINNLYSKNYGTKKLLSKYDSSYNLKTRPKYIKSKNLNINTSENFGKIRHIDRKIIKGNKNRIISKKGYKLFTTTKIINNFNNQINQSKNKETFSLFNNNINNDGKIDVLFEIEKKVSKIQDCFRKHLEGEKSDIKQKENISNNNVIDIISDISLSEEEINFSEEESFNNEFSLDEEEF